MYKDLLNQISKVNITQKHEYIWKFIEVIK